MASRGPGISHRRVFGGETVGAGDGCESVPQFVADMTPSPQGCQGVEVGQGGVFLVRPPGSRRALALDADLAVPGSIF